MAVTLLNSPIAFQTGDPDGNRLISSGGGERMGVLEMLCENNGDFTPSITLGGVAPTYTVKTFRDEGSSDTINFRFIWNEAALVARADDDIDYSDAVSLTKVVWTWFVLDGVDQTTPKDDYQTFESSADVTTVTTTSTLDDYIAVGVTRTSGNRDIESWDSLTETDQYSTLFKAGHYRGQGGDNVTTFTGDGIADDWNISATVFYGSGNNIKSASETGTFSADESAFDDNEEFVFDIGVVDAFEDAIKHIIGPNDSGDFSATESVNLNDNLVALPGSDDGTFSTTESQNLVGIGTTIKSATDDVSDFTSVETNANLAKLDPTAEKGPVTDNVSSLSATETSSLVGVDVVLNSSDALTFQAEEDLVLTGANTVVLQRQEAYTFTAIEDASRTQDKAAIDGDFTNWTAIETAQGIVKIDYDPAWDDDDTPWGGVELGNKDFVPVFLDGANFKLLARSQDISLTTILERRAAVFDKGRPILGRGVYPQIIGRTGDVVKISLGCQDAPDGAVEWEGPYDFVIGEDIYVDFAITGRYLAVRFESEDIATWTLQSYDIDYEVVGVY